MLSLSSAGKMNAAPPPTSIVLMGDSTVAKTSGWGDTFASKLKPGVVCTNAARGGQSTKSFLDQGLLTAGLKLHPTYVMIQFGHNDMPGKGANRETIPNTTYKTNLIRFIDESRAAGATPILVTPVVRRIFDRKDGKLIDGLAPYAEAMKAVAKEKHVPLVDLHARSAELMQKLGAVACQDIGPMTAKGTRDGTHLSPKGAKIVTGLIIEELKIAAPDVYALIKS